MQIILQCLLFSLVVTVGFVATGQTATTVDAQPVQASSCCYRRDAPEFRDNWVLSSDSLKIDHRWSTGVFVGVNENATEKNVGDAAGTSCNQGDRSDENLFKHIHGVP